MLRLRYLILTAILVLSVTAWSAVPQQIVHQGRLLDSTGDPVVDSTYSIQFTIYDAATGGSALWSSGVQSVAIVGGLFTYVLGQDVAFPSGLFSSGSDRWLGVTVTPDAEIAPRTKLFSSAYALLAEKSEQSDSADYAMDAANADTAQYSLSALWADSADYSIHSDTAEHSLTVADNSISSNQIADGGVSLSDLGQNGAASGEVIKWNGSNWATAADNNTTHTGSIYRWNTFDCYHSDGTPAYLMGNNPDMYGGLSPLQWNLPANASQMSADSEVLRTLFTRKGYGGKNANVVSETWIHHGTGTANGRFSAVLFRVRNNTAGSIPWTLQFYYSSSMGYQENASVALNGANSWSSSLSNSTPSSTTSVVLSLPPNQVSTIIVVSGSGPGSLPGGSPSLYLRFHQLGFFNNCLELPAGLEYVDDLDVL